VTTTSAIQRVGILTGGGDAPGLNAVIRGAVLAGIQRHGYEMLGIREGFDGLLARLPTIPLTVERVQGLHMRGGTILGAANRGSPFARPVILPDGTPDVQDFSHEAIELLAEQGIDALIVAGGDGTMGIAHKLAELGVRVVGVPKTIDNDLALTDVTFGFDTAIATATEALDRLQTTAESHHRVMVLEVMGRDAGWIALTAGVSGGADAILIPEIPFDLNIVFDKIRQINLAGRRYSLIVVAEGATPLQGEQVFYIGQAGENRARLGGIGNIVGNAISENVKTEVRVTVLGHLQRGGQPTARDRWLATRFGAMAVHLVADHQWGQMVALQGTAMIAVPMSEAVNIKRVDPDGEMVQMARDVGITFGG
jgi:6-phosphofructokinase 1